MNGSNEIYNKKRETQKRREEKDQKKKKKKLSQYDAKKESFMYAKCLVAQLANPSISNCWIKQKKNKSFLL